MKYNSKYLILEAPSSGDTNPDPLYFRGFVRHAFTLKSQVREKMGYTRVKQLSSGHNSVDYHENAPGAPGKGGSPGKQSAAHIITGARAAAGAGASARSARAALGEGGAS